MFTPFFFFFFLFAMTCAHGFHDADDFRLLLRYFRLRRRFSPIFFAVFHARLPD